MKLFVICLLGFCALSCSESKKKSDNWLAEIIKDKPVTVDVLSWVHLDKDILLSDQQSIIFMQYLYIAAKNAEEEPSTEEVREGIAPAPSLGPSATIYINWVGKRDVNNISKSTFKLLFFEGGTYEFLIQDEQLKKQYPRAMKFTDDKGQLTKMLNELI